MADTKVGMMDCQSASSSAKMTADVMVRMMGCLLVASLDEQTMMVRMMGCLLVASLDEQTMMVRLMGC
jgi:hypothetical protein